MTLTQSLYHRFQRYRTLQTDRITALPIVILMPHSACNCQCIMCDIWKGNKNLQQLTEEDVRSLLSALKKLGTKQVLMSGGEALLNPNFFRLCEILRQQHIKISLLSTGITLQKHADAITKSVSEVIVSLDGPPDLHDRIRNIPNAFKKLSAGVQAIKSIDPLFRVTSRTVIHRLNFRDWEAIIDTARDMGIDQTSFLPADVSSHAFNREVLWSDHRQHEILLEENDLPALQKTIDNIITKIFSGYYAAGFIAEGPVKLQRIYEYYGAFYNRNPFPFKKCNAPWVSAVVEADGTVRPCFFHAPLGNIRRQSLDTILNSEESIRFRKNLDMNTNDTCVKCVCYLNLSPHTTLT